MHFIQSWRKEQALGCVNLSLSAGWIHKPQAHHTPGKISFLDNRPPKGTMCSDRSRPILSSRNALCNFCSSIPNGARMPCSGFYPASLSSPAPRSSHAFLRPGGISLLMGYWVGSSLWSSVSTVLLIGTKFM